MKSNKNKSFIFTVFLSFLPLKCIQANIISFDIETNQNYKRVVEQTSDGKHSDNTDWININTNKFSTQIDVDLFSNDNKNQVQDEHHFDSDGNNLAWWMTIFDYASQDIYTPYANELLGQVNLNDYEYSNDQYTIFAGGTYHYNDPESDLDVKESITFRRELSSFSITSVDDGEIQNDFSYWQQFTIELPNPLSFETKTYFDSNSTDEILAKFSGSSVLFETYIAKRKWWNNNDYSQFSHKFVETGYKGYGAYHYQSVSVPEPTTLTLFFPFALMCYVLRKRKLNFSVENHRIVTHNL